MPTGELRPWGGWDAEIASDLVAEFEGHSDPRPDGLWPAYKCAAGVWTLGYGHTGDVQPTDAISPEDAKTLLADDLRSFAKKMRPLVTAYCTAGQFRALLSLAYNIGLSAFSRSSVRRLHNAGAVTQAAEAFLLWKFAAGKPILLKRRRRERREYLS